MIAANPVTLPLPTYKATHVRFEVDHKVATLILDWRQKEPAHVRELRRDRRHFSGGGA